MGNDRYHIHLTNGESISFRELFRKFYPSLHAFARALLKDSDLAHDIVQEAFLKLWLRGDKISSSEHLKSWLFRVVKNEAISYFRAMEPVAVPLKEAENLAEERTVEDDCSLKETCQSIQEAVQGLPSQRRKVFIMSRFGQLTNKEIAMRLGLSVRTVERHLALARENLGYIRDDFY